MDYKFINFQIVVFDVKIIEEDKPLISVCDRHWYDYHLFE